MKNNKINSLQLGVIIFFFLFASLVGTEINSVTSLAGRDSFISIIIAYIIGLIPLIIFIYLFHQDKNIIELINNTFGKTIGMIINIILLIPIIIISACSLNSISNFLVSQFLSDTPIYIIYIAISIVILYGVYKGFETVSRTALMLSIISILFLIISIIGLIPNIEIDNFLPLFEHGIKKDIYASLIFVISNITPLYILLFISKENITNKEKINKSIIISYTFGILVAFIEMVLTVGTLGLHLTNIYQYPEYIILKKISFFNFFNRIENLISIQWLYLNLLIAAISIFYIKSAIKKEKSKFIVPLISIILMFMFCVLAFKNNTIFINFSKNIYPYINLGYFIIVLIIAIITYINHAIKFSAVKEKKSKKNDKKNTIMKRVCTVK